MGTPDFAVRSLEALIEDGLDVAAVVTQPDRPSGRGRKETAPPVKTIAIEHAIPVLQPKSVRTEEFLQRLKSYRPDALVVVAYGKILPKAVLEAAPMGAINVHASLLPAYRGAAPINWAVINGEPITGVTTMLMDEGMDTGPVLLMEKTAIGEYETAGELYARLANLGGALLKRTLMGLLDKKITPRPQATEGVSFAPIMKKSDGRVDWTKSATTIYNLVRGVTPWPGAFTTLGAQTVKIHSGRIESGSCSGAKPGAIMAGSEGSIVVATGGGAYGITELQIEGKKRVSAGEFLRGFRIKEGTAFV
jgi:methionyl-tRNA formyltransferase